MPVCFGAVSKIDPNFLLNTCFVSWHQHVFIFSPRKGGAMQFSPRNMHLTCGKKCTQNAMIRAGWCIAPRLRAL